MRRSFSVVWIVVACGWRVAKRRLEVKTVAARVFDSPKPIL